MLVLTPASEIDKAELWRDNFTRLPTLKEKRGWIQERYCGWLPGTCYRCYLLEVDKEGSPKMVTLEDLAEILNIMDKDYYFGKSSSKAALLRRLAFLGSAYQQVDDKTRIGHVSWKLIQANDKHFTTTKAEQLKRLVRNHKLDMVRIITGHQDEGEMQFLRTLGGAVSYQLTEAETAMLQKLWKLQCVGASNFRKPILGRSVRFTHFHGSRFTDHVCRMLPNTKYQILNSEHEASLSSFHDRLCDNSRRVMENVAQQRPDRGRCPDITSSKASPTSRSTRSGVGPLSLTTGLLFSQMHEPQVAHVDFAWEMPGASGEGIPIKLGEDYAEYEAQGKKLLDDDAVIAFTPGTIEGMFLHVWKMREIPGDKEKKEASSWVPHVSPPTSDIPGEIVFVPFRVVLVLPKYCLHGGGFSLGGNGRFHFYITKGVAKTAHHNHYSFLKKPNGPKLSTTGDDFETRMPFSDFYQGQIEKLFADVEYPPEKGAGKKRKITGLQKKKHRR